MLSDPAVVFKSLLMQTPALPRVGVTGAPVIIVSQSQHDVLPTFAAFGYSCAGRLPTGLAVATQVALAAGFICRFGPLQSLVANQPVLRVRPFFLAMSLAMAACIQVSKTTHPC